VTTLSLSVSLPDQDFHNLLHSIAFFHIDVAPPGVYLHQVLNDVSAGKPLRILGTGCLRDADPSALMSDGWDTFYIAKWVKDHLGSVLDVVEIDPKAIKVCSEFLKQHDLDSSVTLWTQDSLDFMETWDQPVDVFVLDSCDGLEHGLAEFKAALNFNPWFIIMDDWDTKVALAAQYAQENNIQFQRVDRYTVFKTRRSDSPIR